MKLTRRNQLCLCGLTVVVLLLLSFHRGGSANLDPDIPLVPAERKSFDIDVKTVGELESARSNIIASSIKGDQAKIIFLTPDGRTVKEGELLVKMDPGPFEEKLEKITARLAEQQAHVKGLEANLLWETTQTERDNKTAEYEVEAAALELAKIKKGDGPLETSRLQSAMQKARAKYEECLGFAHELDELEAQGFLNPAEVKQAQKRLQDDKEAFEVAEQQYESYVNHVYPMLLKKAEVALKQARVKKEETYKMRGHALTKASVELQQNRQAVEDLKRQLKEAERELAQTEILAPSPGMVVHREEFRSGQRRKPQIGDLLVKNQPIMDLPDLDSMVVKSKVREIDLCKVCVGKKATVKVDAYPDLHFSGAVANIGVLALPDPGRSSEEKYFEIRVALDKGDSSLRPGMTARLIVHSDHVVEAIAIPIHAVFHEQKQPFCYVATPKGFEKRAVDIGLHNEEWVEIRSGVNEKEQVCLVMPTHVL